ncbi:MAG: CotS family spore coat protein [Clostridium sp.]|nr:CotS family spore coat protein [Clostridium sp.]
MNKLRYAEKNYLSNYELSLEFFNELDIKVNDITPLRKVFLLKTDDGNKILKRVDYQEDRLKFINNTINEIGKDFKNIIRFSEFKNGKTYLFWKGSYYIVMDLIQGREASFTNPLELNMCAKTLAQMHLASRKVIDKNNLINKIDVSFGDKLFKALKELEVIETLIEKFKFKNSFDNIIYENINNYIEQIRYVKKALKESSYDEYRSEFKNVVICHNDLAEHNFIYSKNEMYLIDFDYSSVDLRIMDIADIILKGIKNAAFDIDKSIDLIETYDSIYAIEEEEYKLIYILLAFPRDICALARSYYFKQKNWEYEVFLNRLKTKVENDKFRLEFLNKFKDKFL